VPNNLAIPLSSQNLLVEVSPLLRNEDFNLFKLAALQSLRLEGQLYGIPITTDNYALYYNTDLVRSPATSLAGLLAEAERGKLVAIRTSFFGAAWGIAAFGGQVQAADGRILLDQGGFSDWLNWLRDAQLNTDTMLFSSEKAPLIEKFKAGEAAYYTGDSRDLLEIQAALGDKVAVALLPDGPAGKAAPFLETEAFMLSARSSPAQRQQALRLALFMVAAEQQRRLMNELGRVPAVSDQVRIDEKLASTIGSFLAQSGNTISFKGWPITRELVFGEGREIYEGVLGGVLSPQTAAQRLAELNTRFAYQAAQTEASCDPTTAECP
jgi:arabinogalactan oligomer / maltooligosaccharide transport system substrate-binding protein